MRPLHELTSLQEGFFNALGDEELRRKCPNERGGCWADKEFFKEKFELERWQTAHTKLLEELVALGVFMEWCATNGTMLYQLTDTGRAIQDQRNYFAGKHVIVFNPHNQPSLFDRSEEF